MCLILKKHYCFWVNNIKLKLELNTHTHIDRQTQSPDMQEVTSVDMEYKSTLLFN